MANPPLKRKQLNPTRADKTAFSLEFSPIPLPTTPIFHSNSGTIYTTIDEISTDDVFLNGEQVEMTNLDELRHAALPWW